MITLDEGSAATQGELLSCQWQKHERESRNAKGPFVLGSQLENYPFFFQVLGQTKLHAQGHSQVAIVSQPPHLGKGVDMGWGEA